MSTEIKENQSRYTIHYYKTPRRSKRSKVTLIKLKGDPRWAAYKFFLAYRPHDCRCVVQENDGPLYHFSHEPGRLASETDVVGECVHD